MITPPGAAGRVIFSDEGDGDLRSDDDARLDLSRRVGIPGQWATVGQVHGSRVVKVDRAGDAGEADALWTVVPGLPLAVFTADCFPVAVLANDAAGIAHAGWRGTAGRVVGALRIAMERSGFPPTNAFIGPGIGPCCFEVGEEVVDRFPRSVSATSWQTTSVDLAGSIASQLEGMAVWIAGACTMHEPGWFSHRRDATTGRQAAIAWL